MQCKDKGRVPPGVNPQASGADIDRVPSLGAAQPSHAALPALVPAIFPNTEPETRPVPPG
jgi:hypothetical protein